MTACRSSKFFMFYRMKIKQRIVIKYENTRAHLVFSHTQTVESLTRLSDSELFLELGSELHLKRNPK
jgi:hypothetical protein